MAADVPGGAVDRAHRHGSQANVRSVRRVMGHLQKQDPLLLAPHETNSPGAGPRTAMRSSGGRHAGRRLATLSWRISGCP
ncbi:hypothetical protein GCM10023346_03910 [Arthrobacter gyeryongensis]|uniref:Transposase n=1 Tax=Arthrobacter gyeryongensis TaxID=1650592 RepID=A0ABP9S1S9_9MICC